MGIQSSPLSAPSTEASDAPAAIERQIEFERINTLYLIAQPMLVTNQSQPWGTAAFG